MARHLMAVCVVCLLCADHLPCKEHFLSAAKDEINNNDEVRISGSAHVLNANNPINQNEFVYDKRKDKTKALLRFKRHADHGDEHSEHEMHEDMKQIFLQKLFDEFANKSSKTMNVNGFEQMLQRLNLYHLITNETDKISDSDDCMNGLEFVSQLTNSNSPKMDEYRDMMESLNPSKHSHDSHEYHDHHEHSEHSEMHHHHEEADSKSPKNVSLLLSEIKKTLFIDFDQMTSICPILLYQLVTKSSSLELAGCVNQSLFKHVHSDVKESVMEDRASVWLYSTLAVLGVSLCGLLGVAVIPFMDKHYYNHVIQFLVALAVGTLCGDALLHLLPHAMMPTSSTEDQHTMMMMRGLAAVCGIAFFYFFERFLTMITEWRKKIQKRDDPSSRVRVICDPESVSLNGVAGCEKLCKHKYSSYPYCYDEIAMDTRNDHHEHNHVERAEGEAVVPHKRHSCPTHGEHGDHHKDHVITPDVAKNLLAKPTNGNVCNNNGKTESRTVSTSMHSVDGVGDKLVGVTKPLMEDETYTIILREHESKHHGHSHTHGHVHSPPRSLSAVVWMVIMGDGLHNFTDGMAIGAAFSMNIAGGLSTAVAVFCHELPHELGDFAVLLKAGMSAKQAVYYNVLSSILSFFGMCIGIMIGDTPEASSWIFAAAAGMFIYIALVDMMPELTSSHKEESCMLSECFLQFFGMFTGFGTMLLIAMYEHDLKQIFSS